ncbi:PAS domain S-box protein [bacterium]|nr:PAS domain S-box protein [bacterium]MBP9808791.1 PAS domain S-box protein [bacterium]
MNRVKVGIVAKGLIIVAIPLVFSCYFVATMTSLQSQLESAAARAEHARAISTLLNGLIHDLYMGMGSITLKVDKFSAGLDRKERIEAAKTKIQQLTALIGRENTDNKEDLSTLQAVEHIIDQGNSLVKQAEQAYLDGNKVEVQRLRMQAQNLAGRLISPELIALGERQKAISVTDPSIQAELRQQMHLQLWASLIVSILATVSLAFLTTRSVTRRLAHLTEHSRRIAQGEALVTPIMGNDEISELDQVLHNMAAEIEALIHRERIIIENAGDIICVIDNSLKITTVSPSVEALLGISAQKLLGSSYLTILDRENSEVAISTIARAASGGTTDCRFEATLNTSAGKAINCLVSLSFVQREEILILIFRDITKLKEAERFKQHVVSMVSHDLRSPLTAVSHILEMFEEAMFGELNQEGKIMLGRADQSTKQMSRLITDLLDLDKIESGKLNLSMGNFSSNEILERAQMLTADLAQQAKCNVRIEKAEGHVSCDVERVSQVLTNLIGNALKVSPPGEEIVLRAEMKSSLIQFSVRDSGPGIAPELHSLIFERFKEVRVDEPKTGADLGLAICKALVELHGGTIEIESNGQPGSCFIFTLPQASS